VPEGSLVSEPIGGDGAPDGGGEECGEGGGCAVDWCSLESEHCMDTRASAASSHCGQIVSGSWLPVERMCDLPKNPRS
jgi:hypothetical protein